MQFEKNRKRRIIFNDDSDQQYRNRGEGFPHNITDEQSFIDARTTPTFDTHVDTYVWCVGNGAEPSWGPWGEKRELSVHPFLSSPQRATDVIVDACHAEGMEVWGSLRMNDLHDSRSDKLENTNDALKALHPEYLIGKEGDRDLGSELVERYLWTAFNYEVPEVRQHRLEFIGRNASAHDFDGYELDFTRFIWSLPEGRERELAPLMTDFVRDVRAELDAIADRRGRPYTLAVHVVDSLETSLLLGLDVGTWVSEGLVDVLVVGMGSKPYTLQLDQWKELGERNGAPVYPALNTRALFRLYKDRTKRVSALHEYIRAAAAWWWHSGADGIYLFNIFTHHEEEGVGPLDKEVVYAPLKSVGDPTELRGKDKLYGIEASSGQFSQGAEAAALPVPLEIPERRLPLRVGPDADDPTARFAVHAWTSGGSADTKVWMRLNHTLLETLWQDGHYTAEVPAGIMRVGRNELAMFCNAELLTTPSPIIVHEILTSVTY